MRCIWCICSGPRRRIEQNHPHPLRSVSSENTFLLEVQNVRNYLLSLYLIQYAPSWFLVDPPFLFCAPYNASHYENCVDASVFVLKLYLIDRYPRIFARFYIHLTSFKEVKLCKRMCSFFFFIKVPPSNSQRQNGHTKHVPC